MLTIRTFYVGLLLGFLLTACVFTVPLQPFTVEMNQGTTVTNNLGIKTFVLRLSDGYGNGFNFKIPVRIKSNRQTTSAIKAKHYFAYVNMPHYVNMDKPIELDGPYVYVEIGRTTVTKPKEILEGYVGIKSEDGEVVVRETLQILPE